MKLRFTPRAVEDLSSIGEYIRADNPIAALRVRDAILDAIKLLVNSPRIGRRQHVEGVRKLLTRRYPYLIYYRENEASREIEVLSIQHGARDREYRDA